MILKWCTKNVLLSNSLNNFETIGQQRYMWRVNEISRDLIFGPLKVLYYILQQGPELNSTVWAGFNTRSNCDMSCSGSGSAFGSQFLVLVWTHTRVRFDRFHLSHVIPQLFLKPWRTSMCPVLFNIVLACECILPVPLTALSPHLDAIKITHWEASWFIENLWDILTYPCHKN